MSLFYVEKQPWQTWPKVLIVGKKSAHGNAKRIYVPELMCFNRFPDNESNFCCSICDSDLQVEYYKYGYQMPNYCPNCGAKVVSE